MPDNSFWKEGAKALGEMLQANTTLIGLDMSGEKK